MAAVSIGAGARAAELLAGPFPAQVVRVVDGDTIEVSVRIWLGQTIQTRVRLAGIDAPELRGKCAAERDLAGRAKTALGVLIGVGDGAGKVSLRNLRYGKFAGRVVAAVVTADGRDAAAVLVSQGLARVYAGGRRADWCAALAAEAQ